jgi:roadblock/LC7 domain-containing protein
MTNSRNDYNKLIRITRIVRLYRLLRIFRLFKIMKLLRYSVSLQRIMEKIKMNAAASRMILITFLGIFFVHLVSCFWYFAAKMDDFGPDTWIFRLKMQDHTMPHIYLECCYWSFQTIATVGFGEFSAITYTELIMSILWMICGVSFYSIIIGNLTSMIANETANSENLFVSLIN